MDRKGGGSRILKAVVGTTPGGSNAGSIVGTRIVPIAMTGVP